jgi:hypothetical protein
MRRISLLWLCLSLLLPASAQVLPANEIKDPELRALQERNMDELKKLGADILALPTDYPFYLSRKLDVDEAKQKWADQRSIQFDRYQGKIVLQITGNYFAAYSAEKMDADQRARETFLRVAEPILKAAVAHFQNNTGVQAYALEISHHVLGKVGGIGVERPENLVIVLPQAAAIRLAAANDDNARQSALRQAEVFINAKPAAIWLSGEARQVAEQSPPEDPSSAAQSTSQSTTSSRRELLRGGVEQDSDKLSGPVPLPTLKPVKPSEPPAPPRDISPESLSKIQSSYQKVIDQVAAELDSQAHFVAYQKPGVVAFRKEAYLEFSLTSALPASAAGSRYKMAALAFDEHIAHLVRPVASYLKGNLDFDGVAFSTTIHLQGKAASSNVPANQGNEAVEFFFPTSALRCYETYDCTGQQLIDRGSVLINGERVSLDLQVAEAGVQ